MAVDTSVPSGFRAVESDAPPGFSAVESDAPPGFSAVELDTERDMSQIGLDLISSFGRGSNALLKTAGDIYGLATGDVENFASKQGQEGINYFENLKSPELKNMELQRDAKINAATGVLDKAGVAFWSTLSSPSLISSFIVEQIPLMVPGGVVAKGAGATVKAMGATKKLADLAALSGAVGTGAALQGGDIGADAYDSLMAIPNDVWSINPEVKEQMADGATFDEAKKDTAISLARNAGIAAAVISVGTNLLPGARVIEKRLAGIKLPAASKMGGAIKGFLGEATQEMSEEGGGKFASNIILSEVDPDTDISAGVGESLGLGALGGGVLGSLASITSGAREVATTTNTNDAINVAQEVINSELARHRVKEEALKAPIEAQPKIQDEIEKLVTDQELSPEKIKVQEELDLKRIEEEFKPMPRPKAIAEEVKSVKQPTAESVIATEIESVSREQARKEKVPFSTQKGLKSQDEIQRAEKTRPTEALVSKLTLSKEVPQVKSGANVKGVVEPLGGTFDPVGAGPLQVWVRKDGTQEVISGRHRLDLAQRSGTESVNVQRHFEDAGFSLEDAKSLDAILNIREGQGQVKDYVDFIKTNEMTEVEAEEQGLLARNTGKQAFTVATKGSGLLIDAHAQGELSDSAATKISLAAPKNEALQAVGLKAIADGKTITVAENMTKAVATFAVSDQPKTADLFGFDDAALMEAEVIAKAASVKQAGIQKTLSAIQGAAKDPKRAAKEGVDVKDPVAVQRRIDDLKQQKSAWANWHSSPELVTELRTGIASTQKKELDLISDETQQLGGLVETAPLIAEMPEDDIATIGKLEAVTIDTVEPSDTSIRMKAYETTLAIGAKVDPVGFEAFISDMKVKFDKAAKLAPKGTLTNQKDFTQFVQAQSGQTIPLNEINLTRKITGKEGKIQVVQVKADVVLRQTRKKRKLALELLRCIHG